MDFPATVAHNNQGLHVVEGQGVEHPYLEADNLLAADGLVLGDVEIVEDHLALLSHCGEDGAGIGSPCYLANLGPY